MNLKDEAFCKAMGLRIAAARKEQKLTQVQLAALLGVAQQTIANYENGNIRVPIDLLPNLAAAINITLDELLMGQTAPKTPGKRGPTSHLQQQLAAIAALPTAKQKAVSVVLDALIAQHGITPPNAPAAEQHAG